MFWESLLNALALVEYDLVPNHQSPLVFIIIRMLAIIIEVFLHCEQRSVHLERCCTIPVMLTACLSDMVYHWLPCCNTQTTCTPIQLKASVKWKWCKPTLFILVLLRLALSFLLLHTSTDAHVTSASYFLLFPRHSNQKLDLLYLCGFVFCFVFLFLNVL